MAAAAAAALDEIGELGALLLVEDFVHAGEAGGDAVAQFLKDERQLIDFSAEQLKGHLPFKKQDPASKKQG